jgi:hypothetical protein
MRSWPPSLSTPNHPPPILDLARKKVFVALGMNKFPGPNSHSNFWETRESNQNWSSFSRTVSQSASVFKMFRLRFPRIPIQRFPTKRSFTNYGQAQRIPTLKHDFTNGVPGLLSPPAFDIAWTQYQTLMIEKLNQLLAGRLFLHQVWFGGVWALRGEGGEACALAMSVVEATTYLLSCILGMEINCS